MTNENFKHELELFQSKEALPLTIFCEMDECSHYSVILSDLIRHFVEHAVSLINQKLVSHLSRGLCGMCHCNLFDEEHNYKEGESLKNTDLNNSYIDSTDQSCRGLVRHMLFHAYQLIQRSNGEQLQLEEGLPTCKLQSHIDSDKKNCESLTDVTECNVESECYSKCSSKSTRNCIPDLPTSFDCEWFQCRYSTDNILAFHRHVRRHSKEQFCSSKSGQADKKPKYFSCQWKSCHYIDRRRGHLEAHMSSHSVERPFACPQCCGAVFATKEHLRRHLHRQYVPLKVVPEIEKTSVKDVDSAENSHLASTDMTTNRNVVLEPQFQCLVCWKGFASQSLLSQHVKRHVSVFKCFNCEFTASSRSAIRSHHAYRHSSGPLLLCERCCKYQAKTVGRLNQHLLTCGSGRRAGRPSRSSSRGLHRISDGEEADDALTAAVQDKSLRYHCHLCELKFCGPRQLIRHAIRAHQLSRAPGFTRFQMQLSADGFYRIQTTRLESSILRFI